MNGLPHPINPTSIDFENNDYHEVYYQFLESLQSAHSYDNLVCISKEFKNGYTLFSFDMSADQHGGMNHNSLYNVPASIQLKLKFKQGQNPDSITLLVYYKTTSHMLVDASCHVQVISS